MVQRTVRVYTDYKSPYAYLAKDLAYALEGETGARLVWLPYTLDIPSFLGSASVDARGTVLQEARNAHQWRRVKYSYLDCRREANKRGLIIRGPQKIFDSSAANIGMLFAERCGVFRDYHDRVFARFWKRELDIEDSEALAAVLRECGAPTVDFTTYLAGEGRRRLDEIRREAEALGVFGVPSFVLEGGDLYWGREHLPHIRELLTATPMRA